MKYHRTHVFIAFWNHPNQAIFKSCVVLSCSLISIARHCFHQPQPLVSSNTSLLVALISHLLSPPLVVDHHWSFLPLLLPHHCLLSPLPLLFIVYHYCMMPSVLTCLSIHILTCIINDAKTISKHLICIQPCNSYFCKVHLFELICIS